MIWLIDAVEIVEQKDGEELSETSGQLCGQEEDSCY